MSSKEYKITTLEGIDAVRKLTGMYLGDPENGQALHHMLMEVIDNSVDEYLSGYCDKIVVTLHKDNSASVADNGRGIPTYFMPEKNMSATEVIFCTLHAGGKFDKENYNISGGLHGVGVSCTNAVSARLKVVIYRDGKEYSMAFEKGRKVEELSEKNISSKKSGTFIRFGPDLTIFKNVTKFDPLIIEQKIRELSYLCRGLELEFINEHTGTKKIFSSDNNISDFVEHLAPGPLVEKPMVFTDDKTNISIDVALQWLADGSDTEISRYFTNNIPNMDGGSHAVGFKTALTRTINNYIANSDLPKTLKISLSGDDIREGLISVVSIRHPDPKFSSQTKDKLVSEDARSFVDTVVSNYMSNFLEQNPALAKKIVTRCVSAFKAREAAKKAREATRKSLMKDGSCVLPGKLADCSSKDPAECELFIVEGDSAGGCFSANTLISLPNGLEITFEDLVEDYKNGKEHFCYTINNGKISIGKITNPRITRKNATVIKLIMDNGSSIICTPDHLLMKENGEYVKAKDSLSISLKPLYRRISGWKKGQIKGYEMFWSEYDNKWKYTHIISDFYNIQNKIYSTKFGENCRHHVDFNKTNNYPTNIIRMSNENHFELHRNCLEHTLHRPDVKEKSKLVKQTLEFREKMSKKMSEPAISKMLSERAKKQWEDEEYKAFMVSKWKEFYDSNEEYREQNNKTLYENQKEYWNSEQNRKKQSVKIKQYFEKNPDAKENNRQKAIEEWENEELLEWRKEKTKEQWTDGFRAKRKEAYNRTYYKHTIEFMKHVLDTTGSIDDYDSQRKENGSRNLLKKDTFVTRFFDGDEELMMDAINNYNHKVVKIIQLEEKMDVYDLEVPGTHNFALASGIFVHNSAKQGRNREFQAILPLRGKVLNVEKCEFQRMIANEELTNLITAMGVGIGKNLNPDNLRYDKIIINTDSDVDGSHIRTLLLTFFFRQMPQLIYNGNIYIAQPPLYRLEWRRNAYYLKDDNMLRAFAKEKGIAPGQLKIQRFKGLGEMSPEQLWETTMNPETRTLLRVVIDDFVEADRIFNILMGTQVEPRKEFLVEHALSARNLDT